MLERPGTSVPRCSLRPTVQPGTSPFRRAKSTARTTSPRLNMYGRRVIAIAVPSDWNSLPDPVRNPNSTEAAFRRLLKTFLFARYCTTSALRGLLFDALYKRLKNRDHVVLVTPFTVVRDLGIYLDSDVSMCSQVARTVSNCFFILRRLRSIRRSLTRSVFQSIVVALVLSKLDFGNATLAIYADCSR